MSGDGTYRQHLEGGLDGSGLQIALVVGRFHGDLTEQMLDSAVATLLRHHVEAGGLQPLKSAVVRLPRKW